MLRTIDLPDALFQDAQSYAAAFNRSVPKQIEYWLKIGKIAEENPDLPYGFIKEILLAKEDVNRGDTSEYQFG